jgi:hypothetical protein
MPSASNDDDIVWPCAPGATRAGIPLDAVVVLLRHFAGGRAPTASKGETMVSDLPFHSGLIVPA